MKVLQQIDRQDVLLVVGVVSFLGGIGAFSAALAAIVGGLMCFFAVYLIARAEASAEKTKGIDGSARK